MNGSKWSDLSRKLLTNRTEHAIKYSLVSSYTSLPIRTIKKKINYIKSNLVQEVLIYNQRLNLMETEENNEKWHFTENIEKSTERSNLSFIDAETSFSLFSCFDEDLINEILE